TKLEEQGYSCGEEETEDIIYGDGTESAVVTLQACAGLPESGVADAATWAFLMEDNHPGGHSSSADGHAEQQHGASHATQEGASASASSLMTSNEQADNHPHVASPARAGGKTLTKWPMLREGDGGAAVHGLQVALDRMGFNPGREDMQWWQFGDTTYGALQTMQACSHLPETGVADEATWKSLLGADARPEDIALLLSGGEDDVDMTEEMQDRGVWLVGEQRFSKRQM
ncbi:hypothetical protein WJX84_000034, partial [Apatococcus fuscideae]